MNWEKQGLIYDPRNLGGWRSHSFMTPTPFLIDAETIRVYGGFRDSEGISRIGYIDLKAENPKEVISVSESPALDIGKEGMFDDNGVILGSVIANNGELWMYYVGFQVVKKVKFLAFSGLAISTDNGDTFSRVSSTPILDRCEGESYIRAIHSVIKEKGNYKIWYAAGDDWEVINKTPYPRYSIKYLESEDGINIATTPGRQCISIMNDEYRIGRPTTYAEDGKYKMFYTTDTFSKKYSSGYAESTDGLNWLRKDGEFNLQPSAAGWDSEMICYPAPIKTKYGTYLFYSGNGMGATGVGYAQLHSG